MLVLTGHSHWLPQEIIQRMSLSVTVDELSKACLNTRCSFCLGRNVLRNVMSERTAERSFLFTQKCASFSLE